MTTRTNAFDEETTRALIKKLARPGRLTRVAVIERALGEQAGAFVWHLWNTRRFDVTPHYDLVARMAEAEDCYDARTFVAFVQRALTADAAFHGYEPTLATFVGTTGQRSGFLPGLPPGTDAIARSVARRFPAELEAERRALPGEMREAVTLALAHAGVAPAELPAAATRAVVATRALALAGEHGFDRILAAMFPLAADLHAALLAASEEAEQMSTAALEWLAATAPPAVWVQVLYNVGALWHDALEVARRFDTTADPAVLAALRACADRLLRERAEVTPFRLDVFAVALTLACAHAGAVPDPAYDPLLVAALRVEQDAHPFGERHGEDDRWRLGVLGPDSPALVRMRAAVAALPPARAEAALLAALGIGRSGAPRAGALTDRILASLTAAPTDPVLDAAFAAMAGWDAAEAHAKTDAALAVFAAWGEPALPHLARAQARYRDRAGALFKRFATRIEATT